MRGESRECAQLYFSYPGSGTGGITVTYASAYSAADVEDITIGATNGINGTIGMAWNYTGVNGNPALSPNSRLSNVTFRGSDAFSGTSNYWGVGFSIQNVSDINVDGMTYIGNGAFLGTGLLIQGYKPSGTNASLDSYAVQINVTNYIGEFCATAFQRGDFVQGVDFINPTVTACNFGINMPGGTIGENDQIHVEDGQLAVNVGGVAVACADANTQHMKIEGVYFLIAKNVTAVQPCGDLATVIGSTFYSGAINGNTGVNLEAPGGINNTLIANNTFQGLATGIKSASSITTPFYGEYNIFTGNTANYAVPATSTGFVMIDMMGLGTYTPNVSCSTGSLTTATAQGKFKQNAKIAFLEASLLIANSGNCSGTISLSLPITSGNPFTQIIGGREDAVTGIILQATVAPSANSMTILAANNAGVTTSFAPSNGWRLDLTGSYETQ